MSSEISTIGFPGLGIDEFTINRTAFTLFGKIHVQWYGIILTLGILTAFIILYNRAKKTEGFSEDDIFNITLFTVPISIIGARLVYVVTTWSTHSYNSFYDVIAIWNGGIAIYGAIIFGLITVIVYCKVRGLKLLSMLDAMSPAVMMGQIIGRWGNFVNAEAYGWSEGVEKLPWRMTVGTVRIDGVARPDIQFVHPTFLYESLWNLIGFVIIHFVYKKKKANGEIFSLYMLWYGFGRGFIEMLRTDSLYMFNTKLKFSVFTGFLFFVLGTIMLIYLLKKTKKNNAELAEYEKAFATVDAYDTESVKTEADDLELSEKLEALDQKDETPSDEKTENEDNTNEPS